MKPQVVIVGNGESLLGKGLGPRIDEFNTVVRLNKFVIKPEDTGEKTTVHVYLQGNAPYPDAEVPLATAMPWRYDLIPTGTPKLPWDIMARATRHLGLPLTGPTWPSTGFVAIFNYVAELPGGPFHRPGLPVAIVGFDHGETGHYWDPAHKHGGKETHPWDLERIAVSDMIDVGLVTPLDR